MLFVPVREVVSMEYLRFHDQFVEEEWEVTPFYISNVTAGCIKHCSGMRKCFSKAVGFACRKCSDSTGNAEDDGDVTLVGDVIEKMTKFLYLGDILSSSGGAPEAVTARTDLGGKNLGYSKFTVQKSCVVEVARKLVKKLCEKCLVLWCRVLSLEERR